MHVLIALGLLLVSVVIVPAAWAQDDAWRREMDQLRRQVQTLTERLQAVEARPQPTAATAGPGTVTVSQGPPGTGAPGGPPSVVDLARPREPFALYERRGTGQLLFDMGIAGDFIANLTQRSVDKANAGTFGGRENRFFPREVEISLFGQIDPYARAEVRFEAGEEEQGEIAVHLAEAHLSLMTLPWGFQLKMGQMRNRFGLLNVIHEHDRPFIDQPNVLTRFLGDEGLVERGAELTWVPPLPFFLEFLIGVFNGDNETAFGRGKLNEPMVTGRLRTFFELDQWGAIQLGASVASGSTPDRRRTTIVGADAKYKLTPDGWLHPLVTVLGEVLYESRRLNRDPQDLDGDGILDTNNETRIRERVGWYAGGEIQPFRTGPLSRWAAGVRYDWTRFPEIRGREWAIGPYLSFRPSEFLRFRLGYKHTERDKRDGFTDNEGSARIVDELLFQATFILGAHPAHPF